MGAKEERVWPSGRWERRKCKFIDVKKAQFSVPDGEFAFVKLSGWKDLEAKAMVVRYDGAPPAQAWEEEYACRMVGIGFARGKSNSTVFLVVWALYMETTSRFCATGTMAKSSWTRWVRFESAHSDR